MGGVTAVRSRPCESAGPTERRMTAVTHGPTSEQPRSHHSEREVCCRILTNIARYVAYQNSGLEWNKDLIQSRSQGICPKPRDHALKDN